MSTIKCRKCGKSFTLVDSDAIEAHGRVCLLNASSEEVLAPISPEENAPSYTLGAFFDSLQLTKIIAELVIKHLLL